MGERRGDGGEQLCLSVQCRPNSHTLFGQGLVSEAVYAARGGEQHDRSTKNKGLIFKVMVRSSDAKLNSTQRNTIPPRDLVTSSVFSAHIVAGLPCGQDCRTALELLVNEKKQSSVSSGHFNRQGDFGVCTLFQFV